MEEKTVQNHDDLFYFVDRNSIESERITAPRYSYWKSVFRVFFKNKFNWFVLGVLILIIVMSFIYPSFTSFDPLNYLVNRNFGNTDTYLLSPSRALSFFEGTKGSFRYILGTGTFGESIWDAIWVGAKTSLGLSITCTIINMTIGVVLGAVWGFSKTFDAIMTQVYNIVANVPFILLISVFVLILPSSGDNFSSFKNFVIAMCITGWLGIAYFIRTQVLIIRDREYNLVSRCLGTPILRIVTKNILPFLTSVIVTDLATELPSYISFEVFLTYLGIGFASQNSTTLGKLINEGQARYMTDPWIFWAPVAVASIITVTLYLIGQNLADASDPRTHME